MLEANNHCNVKHKMANCTMAYESHIVDTCMPNANSSGYPIECEDDSVVSVHISDLSSSNRHPKTLKTPKKGDRTSTKKPSRTPKKTPKRRGNSDNKPPRTPKKTPKNKKGPWNGYEADDSIVSVHTGDSDNSSTRYPPQTQKRPKNKKGPWKKVRFLGKKRRQHRKDKKQRKKLQQQKLESSLFAKFEEIGQPDFDLVEKKGRCVGEYTFTGLLGVGGFAKVYGATHSSSDTQVAIKVMSKSRMKKDRRIGLVNQEIGLMRLYGHHGNLIGIKEVLHGPKNIYIVMEKATMNLQELRDKTDAFSVQPDLLQQIARGTLEAMNFLHSKGLCHLDIKPENIVVCTSALVDKKLSPNHRIEASAIRLLDLGLACASQSHDPDNSTNDNSGMHKKLIQLLDVLVKGKIGTTGYMAPECITQDEYEGRRADMFSLGMTLLAMCAEDYGTEHLRERLSSDLGKREKSKYALIVAKYMLLYKEFRSSDKQHILLHDLVFGKRGLVLIDPNQRATAWQALHHPWMQCDGQLSGICQYLQMIENI